MDSEDQQHENNILKQTNKQMIKQTNKQMIKQTNKSVTFIGQTSAPALLSMVAVCDFSNNRKVEVLTGQGEHGISLLHNALLHRMI